MLTPDERRMVEEFKRDLPEILEGRDPAWQRLIEEARAPLDRHALRPSQRQEAASLYAEQEWSLDRIAAQLGCSPTAISSALKDVGVKPRTLSEAQKLRHRGRRP